MLNRILFFVGSSFLAMVIFFTPKEAMALNCNPPGLSCQAARSAYQICQIQRKNKERRTGRSISAARHCQTRICQVRAKCNPTQRAQSFSWGARYVRPQPKINYTNQLRQFFNRKVIPKNPSDICIRPPACGGNSYVRADIDARCMCVGPTCFRIGVGKNPNWNPTGTAIIKGIYRRDGVGKFQTNAITTTRKDDDAVAVDLPGVFKYGKWFHKTYDCTSNYVTRGCIGVPCDMWPLVKASIGKKATVCRGGKGETKDPRLRQRQRTWY